MNIKKLGVSAGVVGAAALLCLTGSPALLAGAGFANTATLYRLVRQDAERTCVGDPRGWKACYAEKVDDPWYPPTDVERMEAFADTAIKTAFPIARDLLLGFLGAYLAVVYGVAFVVAAARRWALWVRT